MFPAAVYITVNQSHFQKKKKKRIALHFLYIVKKINILYFKCIMAHLLCFITGHVFFLVLLFQILDCINLFLVTVIWDS